MSTVKAKPAPLTQLQSAQAWNLRAHEKRHFDTGRKLGWLKPESDGTYPAPGSAEEASAVMRLQGELGIAVDGKLGRDTMAALRALHLPALGLVFWPIPHGTAAVNAAYGDPKPTPAAKRGRLDVSPAWRRASIQTVTLHTGQTLPAHRLIAKEIVILFSLACKLSGYKPRSDGCWVPRCMNWDPANDPSTHLWGMALDFNASRNGRGRTDTELRAGNNRIFVAVFEWFGWDWGGYFGTPDDMHFQRAYGI